MGTGDLIRSSRVRRLSRREYDRMVSFGLFEKERVELLYGMVVTKCPQDARHSSPIQKLNKRLVLAVGDRAAVRVQMPLALSDESEPEPDLALVPPGDYADEHPRVAWLVIEVANTSLEEDRIKGRLYAQAGVGEYWLVDVTHQRVERYLAPLDGVYTSLSTHVRGEVLHPQRLADVAIALDDIFPV
jgi:Uma2 family endonuclease